jgi:hypothetical protein
MFSAENMIGRLGAELGSSCMHRLQGNSVFLFLPLPHLENLLNFKSSTSWRLLMIIFREKLLRDIASSVGIGYLRD